MKVQQKIFSNVVPNLFSMQPTDILKQRLVELGADPASLDAIINEVNGLAMQRIVSTSFSQLNADQKAEFEKLTDEERVSFLETHPGFFPQVSPEESQNIMQDTWEKYLEYMAEKANA